MVLLGAQRFEPTLGARVAELGITGHIATITAGWQERETDDADLVEHLAGRCVNLLLHDRAHALFAADPELARSHRARQDTLRAMHDLYRHRLSNALEAEVAVSRSHAPPLILEEARLACVQAIREVDAWHLAQCRRVRAEHDADLVPMKRPAVRRQRDELREILSDCAAVAIAGGHVAVLVNRLHLFGIADLIGDRPVFAWSAGAMAISDRVVLFHDSPPQGDPACEVLEDGLGLVPNVVCLPAPEQRLHLADAAHMGVMASRFAPALCLALPARSSVVWRNGEFTDPEAILSIGVEGASWYRPEVQE